MFQRLREQHNDWAEADRVVNIDAPPEIFKLWLEFSHTNTIDYDDEGLEAMTPGQFSRKIPHCYSRVIRFYILADFLMDKTAKNAAMRAMDRLCTTKCNDGTYFPPHPKHMEPIFAFTPKNSPMRRYLCNEWVSFAPPGLISDTTLDDFPEDAVRQMLLTCQPTYFKHHPNRRDVSEYLEKE